MRVCVCVRFRVVGGIPHKKTYKSENVCFVIVLESVCVPCILRGLTPLPSVQIRFWTSHTFFGVRDSVILSVVWHMYISVDPVCMGFFYVEIYMGQETDSVPPLIYRVLVE